MKYVGIYWTVFAPLMKKSIRKRFNKELADQAIRQIEEMRYEDEPLHEGYKKILKYGIVQK